MNGSSLGKIGIFNKTNSRVLPHLKFVHSTVFVTVIEIVEP